MKNNKKICFLIINEKVINLFLINHINNLSKSFDIEFISASKKIFFLINGRKFYNHYLNLSRSFNIINFIGNLIKLLIIILKTNFNLIISIHPKNGLLISLLKYFYNFKLLHIITGQIWANQINLKKTLLKYIDKLIIHKSDYLLSDSKGQISYLKKNGFNVNKISTILNGSICGVDISKFSKSNNAKLAYLKKKNYSKHSRIIIYAGRINFDKGILILLDSFNELIDKYNYDIILLLVGDDELNIYKYLNKYPSKTKQKINVLKYKKNINYYYSISDIFCLPSYREGFGLSVIQASASYLPVVVSDIYGLDDCLKENITGLKFDLNNYKNLSKKLRYLLDNPIKIKQLGYNGREYVKKSFNQEDVVTFLSTYIKNII